MTRNAAFFIFYAAAGTMIASGQTLNTLVLFNSADGYQPMYNTLAQDSAGNLYGTTEYDGPNGGGTLFKVSPTGSLTTIYAFTDIGSMGPSYPSGSLVLGQDGTLYGTSQGGGSDDHGSVFKLSPDGTLTTLYSFTVSGGGGQPTGGLIMGKDGNLYGTTTLGGSYSHGSVFRITPQGALTILHSFHASDGSDVEAGLWQGQNGELFGSAREGGADTVRYHCCGAIFKITPAGEFTLLHTFHPNGFDGATPTSAPIIGSDGNLYGTTSAGGAHGYGEIYRIDPAGSLTVLYSFSSSDGAYPLGGLTLGSDGNLYGTTSAGGPSCTVSEDGCGTIFQITNAGALTTLYFFSGADGDEPSGTLLEGSGGNFYGTTITGGYRGASSGDGTVFSLTTSLGTSRR
jgi:uncharacterized repeat protein (TIGR03803 family)